MLPLPPRSQGGFKLPLPPSPPMRFPAGSAARLGTAPVPAEVRSVREATQLVKCELPFQLEGKIFLSVWVTYLTPLKLLLMHLTKRGTRRVGLRDQRASKTLPPSSTSCFWAWLVAADPRRSTDTGQGCSTDRQSLTQKHCLAISMPSMIFPSTNLPY